MTHLVYSHHHADHAGASSLFDRNVARIGHEETRRLLLRDNDPARPAPEETFQDRRTLEIGGERIELAWHGSNHSPDNIFIHFPDHDTLMLVDIVNPGWVPVYKHNLTEDVPGYIAGPGHRADLPVEALHRRPPGPARHPRRRRRAPAVHRRHRRQRHGRRWTRSTRRRTSSSTARTSGPRSGATSTRSPTAAAAPVIEKYTGVLAAADVFTASTTFHVMQSIRLDLGYGSQVHP